MAQVKACVSEVKQIQQSAGGTDPEALKRFSIRAETSGPTASHVYQSVPELSVRFSGTVHPSDCSSACCGLPLRGDGSADECRRMGPVLVIVDACGRRPPRQLSAPSDGRSLAHEHHRTPHIRSLRALRPASAAAFLRKNVIREQRTHLRPRIEKERDGTGGGSAKCKLRLLLLSPCTLCLRLR